MALLPAEDKRATVDAVREFFDKEWPRIVNMAGVSFATLKSIEITDMPSSPKYGNGVDEKFADHAWASDIVDEVVRVIRNMPARESKLMRNRYINQMNWENAAAASYVSTRRGMEIMEQAMLYFADAFQSVHDFRVMIDDN